MSNIDRLEIQEINIDNLISTVNTSINTADNISETGDLKESIVLDLSKQLSEKFDELMKLEIRLNQQNNKIKKQFLKTYGLISAIDKMTSESVEVPHELQTLIDIMNDFTCDFLDEHFFPSLYRLNYDN